MKRIALSLLIVCSISNATCTVRWVYNPITSTGGLVQVCDSTGIAPTPEKPSRPLRSNLLEDAINGNVNPFESTGNTLYDNLRRRSEGGDDERQE